MFDLSKVGEQFGKECLACGLCPEVCPVIPKKTGIRFLETAIRRRRRAGIHQFLLYRD